MQFFYDGQIRRYVTQTIRVLSNFVVKYGDGTLHQVPVMYGDQDRQVSSIIRQNSENAVNSVPRISVYVSGLDIDRDRLADQTYVGKLNFRERSVNADGSYTSAQGRNYTVERLMPTPFKLTLKCDIWSSSTDQKLQILEQILVLFNPSLELQTTDNYIDWTSLSVLNLNTINWSSRQVPVGTETPIDVASLTFETPIWISPPVKVKNLGVITKVITNLYSNSSSYPTGYEQGLGIDPALQTDGTSPTLSTLLASEIVTITGYKIQVYNNSSGIGQATLLDSGGGVFPPGNTLDITTPVSSVTSWEDVFSAYPGQYVAGSSQLFLLQPNGTYVIGTIALNPLDTTILQVNWNLDTLTSNTGIDSAGLLDTDVGYNPSTSYRPSSPGTFDAIINPQSYTPNSPSAGTRYLIIEDIGSAGSTTGVWGSLVATANDIIEYTGTAWHVIFNASQESDTMIWQTNIYTGVQYKWNGVSWVKSFEGEYTSGQWKIVL
jgi:T4-like virus Myoviridae tail sheath stabiliser